MKKSFLLKALIIAIPVIVGLYAHHYENKKQNELKEIVIEKYAQNQPKTVSILSVETN